MRYSLFMSAVLCSAPALCADAEPKPKIVSLLTLVNEQNEIENQAAPLNGKIESMLWQQVRIEGLSSESKEVIVSSRLKKYDGDNRVIEEEVNRQIALDLSTNTYQNGLLVSTRTRTVNKDGKQLGEEFWQTYVYDPAGQLLDLKRGRGEKLENHFVSKYDVSGRLTRREIRQGAKDALVYTEEFQYNGRPATVERRIVTPEGETKFPTKYRLDADGNVMELWSHQGYHISWKYDGQNRVVEQLTDAYAVPSACDDCPLPGAIRTRYDDHSREQTFFEPGGKAVLQRVTAIDKDGSIVSIRYQPPDHAGPQDAPDLYRVVGSIVPRSGQRYVSTVCDDHGNWTEKKQYFKPITGPAVVQFIYRRKIAYR
jgi:hypothetical protein